MENNQSLVKSTQLGKYSDYFYSKFEKKDFKELVDKIEEKNLWENSGLSLRDKLYLLKKKFI